MQTIDITETIKQLDCRLETLKPAMRVSVAVVIQRLRIRGFGKHKLIDAMLEGMVWDDSFYSSHPVLKETLQNLNRIATDNGCLIGHDMTVNQVHYNFLNKGIVV